MHADPDDDDELDDELEDADDVDSCAHGVVWEDWCGECAADERLFGDDEPDDELEDDEDDEDLP